MTALSDHLYRRTGRTNIQVAVGEDAFTISGHPTQVGRALPGATEVADDIGFSFDPRRSTPERAVFIRSLPTAQAPLMHRLRIESLRDTIRGWMPEGSHRVSVLGDQEGTIEVSGAGKMQDRALQQLGLYAPEIGLKIVGTRTAPWALQPGWTVVLVPVEGMIQAVTETWPPPWAEGYEQGVAEVDDMESWLNEIIGEEFGGVDSIIKPRISDADARLAAVLPVLIGRLEARGFKPLIHEILRSDARQNYLKKGHRSTKWAGPSAHHTRQGGTTAADIVDGRSYNRRKILWGSSDGLDVSSGEIDRRSSMAKEFFAALGQEAKALGLTWGGDWSSFPDPAHVQVDPGFVVPDVEAEAESWWSRWWGGSSEAASEDEGETFQWTRGAHEITLVDSGGTAHGPGVLPMGSYRLAWQGTPLGPVATKNNGHHHAWVTAGKVSFK